MTPNGTETRTDLWTRMRQRWARARAAGIGNRLALGLALLALASGIATFVALTPSSAGNINPQLVRGLLLCDLVLLLMLVAFILRRLVLIWVQRRRGAAGSRLHARLVGLFSVVAVTPTIVVAVFSVMFFNLGLQAWFSGRVNTAVRESVAVAEAYIQEHRKAIQGDILAMAADLNREAIRLQFNPYYFGQVLKVQAELRNLSEAIVVTSAGQVLGRTGLSLLMEFDKVPEWAVRDANAGLVSVLTADRDDRVRALVKLDGFLDAYLFVGRFIDPRVLSHLDRTRDATEQYSQLEAARSDLELTFAILFIMVALLILLAAIWFGLSIANQLVRPIGALIAAAERVRSGDFAARVAEGAEHDELGTLGRAFNRMTSEISAQRDQLIDTHAQADARRRFTETVLSGVSAGVLGLDPEGRITIANRSASTLLGTPESELSGRPFAEALPEMAELFAQVAQSGLRQSHGQVVLVREGRATTLMVRVAREGAFAESLGYVVTFDDITELVLAQRTAAWADIARRIAHEIKNPLTPIQLAAERLKRKYLKEVTSDPDVFIKCTETIVRQVGDIGRMVDEFSSFARMPAPQFAREDVVELVRQAVFLQAQAHGDIAYPVEAPDHLHILCDGRQLSQVLTNLYQNAADAIEGRSGEDLPRGNIATAVKIAAEGDLVLTVTDNGRGLPVENRERLVEPYVTTRAKGTGLGLAIVRKVMEEHGGELRLADAPGGGARITLRFPAASLMSDNQDTSEAGQEPARATTGV